jgi:acyl-CoA synthetase (AMP-forming)/AMP-acid ligase II
MTPADTVLTVLPLFHVGGLCIQTLPALFAGARVILHARFQPDETLACIARERPTLTLQVPATMKALVEHPRWASATDLSCLRAVWAGSSLLPAPLVQAFHARGVPVCNVYGATETGPSRSPCRRSTRSTTSAPAAGRRPAWRRGWGCARRCRELLVRGPNVVRATGPMCPPAMRRLVRHRRPRAAGRRRQLAHRRPRQGPDHLRRREHPPGRDRAGAGRASRRRRMRRLRPAGRALGRTGRGGRGAAPRRARRRGGVARAPRRAAGALQAAAPLAVAARNCRRPRWARCSARARSRRAADRGGRPCLAPCMRHSSRISSSGGMAVRPVAMKAVA